MKKRNLLLFIVSFSCTLAFCAFFIISSVFFPMKEPKAADFTAQFQNGKTDDGYKIMADEFARMIGYETFDNFIIRSSAIVDKSISKKPYYEKANEVAKILKYDSFEKLYFEAIRIFNLHNTARSLIESANVYYLFGESVFHGEYCEILEGKNGTIGYIPSRTDALNLGFTACIDCEP